MRDFLHLLFEIVGIDDEPSFVRSKIVNQLEETQMVLMAAAYLDDETVLNKLPWLTPDEVEKIMQRRENADISREDFGDGGGNDEIQDQE